MFKNQVQCLQLHFIVFLMLSFYCFFILDKNHRKISPHRLMEILRRKSNGVTGTTSDSSFMSEEVFETHPCIQPACWP